MVEKTPPSDPLHCQLWAMGFDEKQRERIIDTSIQMTVICGDFCDPIDLGLLCMPAPKFPKQSRRTRFKFWLRRMWRHTADSIVLPRITKLHFKFEPRDLWVGVYWDVKDDDRAYYVDGHMWWSVVHFYVTVVPAVPLFMEIWFPKKRS